MEEREFNNLADVELRQIEDTLGDDEGFDLELKPGGVIELEFESGGKIVINRHTAAREIWLAARSGGFHFRYQDGRWLGTRDGEELMAAIRRCIAEHGAG